MAYEVACAALYILNTKLMKDPTAEKPIRFIYSMRDNDRAACGLGAFYYDRGKTPFAEDAEKNNTRQRTSKGG